MISLWVHSLLPLLLFLFDIQLLMGQHEDVEVSTTDAELLTATSSWLSTRLLEFSSMSLCKISFSFSSNARLPSSILKQKIDATSRIGHWEMFCKKGVLFCHVSMLRTLVNLFCTERLFSQETVFFPDYFIRDKNGFVLQRIQVFSSNKLIRNWYILQDTQLFECSYR